MIEKFARSQWIEYFKIYNYNGRLAVNCKYRPQLRDHASLRKLIKRGVFTIERFGSSRTSRRTYLVLKNEKYASPTKTV